VQIITSSNTNGASVAYTYDDLNRLSTVVDSRLSGNTTTDTYEYDAFGNVVNKTGSTPNNYLYRGEQWDPDLSLYYLRARYYNPVTDRFLSRDPKPGHIAKPRTLHKYLYVSADGVNRIDPLGKADLVEEDLEEGEEATAEEQGEQAAAKRINCILDAAGDAFNAWGAIESGDVVGAGFGATSLAADFESCAGEATGKKGCCFAAGTPVHTDHGDVPVEKVEVGDEVVS
jgi:RHS repeat-associated protein